MSNSITSWYVTRTFIMPGNFQRSAAISDMLYDVAYGFTKMDAVTAISSGSSTTLTSTGNRTIFVTGSSLTHTIELPAAPAAGDPPIRIYNHGVGNEITISGNGLPIMSGSTAGQIMLHSVGDHIELRYVNGTIGWGIVSINSNRSIRITSSPTNVQMNRFQRLMIDVAGPRTVNLYPPADSQVGDRLEVGIYWNGNTTGINIGTAGQTVMSSAAYDFLNSGLLSLGTPVFVMWKTASTWIVGQGAP